MMGAWTLTLAARRGARLPAFTGHANYAEALAWIGTINPRLAAELHDGRGLKPLTCSTLLGVEEGRPVTAGQVCTVRLTTLNAALTEVVAAGMEAAPPAVWQLRDIYGRASRPCPFDVIGITCDPDQDPWSGREDYAGLAAQHLAAPPPPDATIYLDFPGPTAFKSNGLHVPLPMPGLVFGSLAERWNCFSPTPLEGDVRAAAEREVGVSTFRLESTVTRSKSQGRVIGGQGRAGYHLFSPDPARRAVFAILADYARFSGVGVNTTRGMGQCRRVQPPGSA